MGIPVHHYVVTEVKKYNPNHDGATGQFSSGGGSGGGNGGGGKNAKKIATQLSSAKKKGASAKDISSVQSAYDKKDVEALKELESKFFDPAVKGGHGNPHIGLHTATIHALKELDNSGEFDWQTLSESGDMP